MADIQQWRRMIQPSRGRTPAIDADEADGNASPTTPKRSMKPKLSSYFTYNGVPSTPAKPEVTVSSFRDDLFGLPSLANEEPCHPEPQAESLIDSVMCRLMSQPNAILEPSFNGVLLQIFEGYRLISDERDRLQAQVKNEISNKRAIAQRLQHAQKQWTEERQHYKAEVKRLELLLANGKRGLAEVTLARQDSILRSEESKRRSKAVDDGLQTIFEFLERSKRHEDKAWGNQRAVFKARQSSPSAQMRRLSKQLAAKKSMTNILSDLPFGTPPHATPSTLVQASSLEKQARVAEQGPDIGLSTHPKTSFSDDTLSTFSCVSDLLPDETLEARLAQDAGSDSNLTAMKQIASLFATRRHIDPSVVLPKLLHLFDSPSGEAARNASGPAVLDSQNNVQGEKPGSGHQLYKSPSLIKKASSFFQKFKPQLNVDTSLARVRRFSFEAGDDAAAISSPLKTHVSGTHAERTLRKSVSLSSLPEMAEIFCPLQRGLSPVAQSPTSSGPPVGNRRATKIPTPVYSSMTRPRQEREDSASSLLTAFKHTEGTRRNVSVSSSINSSHPASRTNMRHDVCNSAQPSHETLMATGDNGLLEYTNALHRHASPAATAKDRSVGPVALAVSDDCDLQTAVHTSRNGASNINHSKYMVHPDMSEPKSENVRPIERRYGLGYEDDRASA